MHIRRYITVSLRSGARTAHHLQRVHTDPQKDEVFKSGYLTSPEKAGFPLLHQLPSGAGAVIHLLAFQSPKQRLPDEQLVDMFIFNFSFASFAAIGDSIKKDEKCSKWVIFHIGMVFILFVQ